MMNMQKLVTPNLSLLLLSITYFLNYILEQMIVLVCSFSQAMNMHHNVHEIAYDVAANHYIDRTLRS